MLIMIYNFKKHLLISKVYFTINKGWKLEREATLEAFLDDVKFFRCVNHNGHKFALKE